MQTFLDIVAKDLYSKLNGDFSDIIIVFPNKRASLFFNKALSEITNKPIWGPQYITISELFQRFSQFQLQIGDRIQLVCELYKSYIAVTTSNESLDSFYGWGELMLNDFDDIDKHLACADSVFTLLKDIHELDGVEYLTEKQQKILQQFFRTFSEEHNTELKKRFLQLWNRLGDIYANYRERLKSMNIAYEGMLYRNVIENVINDTEISVTQTYVFIGFNLLHEVETELFSFFHKQGKARFYWDYDLYYMNGHEAGKNISRYIKRFPNELCGNSDIYHNLGENTDISIISSPTEDIQARYITQWLTPERIASGRRTAIVLADETILETVLHCLPPSVQSVNITTGYPLEKSPISSLVRVLCQFFQYESHTLHCVNAVLCHPFAKYISNKAIELYEYLNSNTIFYPSLKELALDEDLNNLFKPLECTEDCKELNSRLIWVVKTIALQIPKKDEFSREALYRMFSILVRLSKLISSDWQISMYQGLLLQIIQTTSIPFHGEPIEGIQIMGVLETRNLDFEHLLLLSCNEGNLPAKVNDSSFIPHSVRAGHGLTTIDNKVSIYSYYFHRLLQRTHDVAILYNNSTTSGHSGEMSRFLLQLIAESSLKINRKALVVSQETTPYQHVEKMKTQSIIDNLVKHAKFSPSALSTYLRCPLKFFYKYVSGIKDEADVDEEELDARVFGNIFHKAAEMLYKPFEGREVTADYIDNLLTENGLTTLQRLVDNAFRTELFLLQDDKHPMPRLTGLQLINREMIIKFLKCLLMFDKKYTPFHLIATELKVYDSISITIDGKIHDIELGGIIDRLDSYKDENGIWRIRVIDYKTGRYNSNMNIPSVEEIFNTDNIKRHSDYFIQALMYSGIISKKYSLPLFPCLLYVQQAAKGDYSPALFINKQPILDANEYLSEYNENVKKLIGTILNKDIPFSPTKDRHMCENCKYASFCR